MKLNKLFLITLLSIVSTNALFADAKDVTSKKKVTRKGPNGTSGARRNSNQANKKVTAAKNAKLKK
jgi:hypothetical protein